MWITIALVLAAIVFFYEFLIWNFDYWKKRGVKSPKPAPFVGNFPGSLTQKEHMVYDIDKLYKAHKQDEDFVGVFSMRTPQLLILNPQLVHQVFVHDFKHFHDNELSTMVDAKTDAIMGNDPFTLTGEAWKDKRALLTPGLTMGRIKTVYPVTNKVCHKMRDYIAAEIKMGSKHGINAKDLCLRFTSEVVTDCVLGLQADSFSDKPTPILGMIKRLFAITTSFIVYFFVVGLLPFFKKYKKIRFIEREVEAFFIDLMQKAIDMRRSQLNQCDRVDFLNYLLQLQDKKNLSTRDLTTNSMTFLINGFDTTATVLSHCLLLLGRYPETQQRLFREIVKHLDENGRVEFEKLTDLPYLDACVHEAIRIFPPAFMSNRICTEAIVLNGKNGRSVKLEVDEVVILPLYSIMMDEEFYANAQQFQPERFLAENGSTVKDYRERGLYYGFGDGPRICIGMRFALTQVKAALVEIVTNFKVQVNPNTRKDNLIDPSSFVTQLLGGVWLDFEARHSTNNK